MKTILVDAYRTFVTDDWINKEMFDMLEGFPNKKIILTNADEEKQEKLGLVNLVYPLFTLSFNPEKSSPEYFEIFLKEYWLTKDEVIYFEHNKEAVESAISFWINTYHYNHEEKNIDSLRKFLEENL